MSQETEIPRHALDFLAEAPNAEWLVFRARRQRQAATRVTSTRASTPRHKVGQRTITDEQLAITETVLIECLQTLVPRC